MNGRSEPLNIKRAPWGFQPGSQTSQCERPGRAASVSGIKLNVYASPLRHLWQCAGRLYRTVVLACLCSGLCKGRVSGLRMYLATDDRAVGVPATYNWPLLCVINLGRTGGRGPICRT